MEAPASLPVLERVIAKYRSDVHQLAPGAPAEGLTSLEGHLRHRIPQGLRAFLARHNGASLFRGSLRIRSAAHMASASERWPQVVLFADGPGEARWAWAPLGRGHVFGRWDGARLEALHTTFEGWLAGSVAVLESRVVDADDLHEIRFEADPDDPFQLVLAGARRLSRGDPDEARSLLQRATARDPDLLLAWQHLGDALAISDRAAARVAWLRAFRRTELPLPWPGAPCLAAEVLEALSLAFVPDAPVGVHGGPGGGRGAGDPERWETELRRFLGDRVREVVSAEGAALAAAAATELARSLVRRGRRREARDALAELLSRSNGFAWAERPWALLLRLARLEAALGHHDEAEALLRQLRREGPAELQARGLLLLARVAVTRQEPWAEDILDEAESTGGLDEGGALEALHLRIERAVRHDRRAEARRHLDDAAARVRRVGLRRAEAAQAFAEGEVLRLEQRPADAHEAYRRAVQLAGERDPELRHRAVLRLGDLAREAHDRAQAEALYREAVEGFGRAELPVREAWALTRLARLAVEARQDPTPWLQPARERFLAADLAAGIAVVDSLAGDPGASLGWHLERATAQARARHDAQRSRPPYGRADADRPERRLGAHRIAVAASGEAVVGALAAEMAACVRAHSAGRAGRPKDPAVLRYVAAVDLLSGHRSFEAARILLEHLLHQAVDGPAHRALQGAIARSPNAALVDGLLRCVERPREVPGRAVAAAAELLGLRREPAAVRPLLRLVEPGQAPSARKAAVVALGRIGERRAADAILPCLDEPALAEAAALALLMLGDRRGIDFHGRALLEARTDLSGHPGELVGRYGGPEHLLLLVNAAEGTSDRALGALQGLGLLGDPRAVPKLLEALRARDRRVADVAAGALQILTGHEEDLETPGGRTRWEAWWSAHEGRFRPGVRHRGGVVFDCGLLIRQMDHPDAWTRRTAYDELVITSGQALPFDADGPWRVQRAHLRAWQAWWRTARARFVPGRWYLDGQVIH